MILEKSKLFDKIKELINEEVNNVDLRRKIINIFEMKKLNQNAIVNVFNNTFNIADLDVLEQIAIAKGCWLFASEKRIYDYRKNYDYTKYFSIDSISYFEKYSMVEEPVTKIIFKNAMKIDEKLYRCNKSYVDIAKYWQKMLITYNLHTQREPVYEKVGNKTIEKPAVDKRTVSDMKKAMLEKTFEDTEIILNVRLVKGKSPYFETTPIYENILVDLEIIPNYTDFSDMRYTVVDILDGYHRIIAMSQAVEEYYQKNGTELEGSIGVKIVLADEERALRIVDQTFKRSETNRQFLDAMKVTDHSVLVADIISKSKELGHVSKTFESAMALKRTTYKAIMINTMKVLKIEAKGLGDREDISNMFAKGIDLYLVALKTEFSKNKKYKEIIDILEHPNFMSGVICYIESINKKGEHLTYGYLKKLVDEVLNNYRGEKFEQIKFTYKSCSLVRMNEFFGGVINE